MNERQSEEEFLLEYDKYSSDMCSNNESNLHKSFSDRDVPHEHTRRKGTQKYLRKATTTALNALKLLFWLHLCGEDP